MQHPPHSTPRMHAAEACSGALRAGGAGLQCDSMHAGAQSIQLESGLTIKMIQAMSPTNAVKQWRQYVERLTSALVEAEMPSAPESCHAALRQVRPCMQCPRENVLSFVSCFSGPHLSFPAWFHGFHMSFWPAFVMHWSLRPAFVKHLNFWRGLRMHLKHARVRVTLRATCWVCVSDCLHLKAQCYCNTADLQTDSYPREVHAGPFQAGKSYCPISLA
jgi:hypothetical protein